MEGRYTTADRYYTVPDMSSNNGKAICMPVFDFEAHGHSSVRTGNKHSAEHKKNVLSPAGTGLKNRGKREKQSRGRMFSRSVLILAVLLTFLITSVSMTLIFGTIAASARDDSALLKNGETIYHEIVVQRGDTLWDIAKEWHGSTEDDIRTYMYHVAQMNHLRGDQVKEGQLLLIYCGEKDAEKLAAGE